MDKNKLLHTKRRLTIIFTLLVFSVAVFLQFSFFSIKYISVNKVEKEDMFLLSNKLRSIDIPINKISSFFSSEKKFLNPNRGWHKGDKHDRIEDGKFMNFIVLNWKNEIISQDIKNDIDLWVVEEVFRSGKNQVIIDSGVVVSVIDYKSGNKLILFKKVRYDFWDYLEDISYFTLIIFLFSVLFYYLWFRFVSRNLEPVEQSFADMHDFIHNAGHELKTPISVIDSNLQLIKETKKFDKELVQEGLLEVRRLNHLIESLIELSNINNNYTWEKLDIEEEIKLIVKEFSVESDKKNIKVWFEVKNKKFFTMNKQYFYILFSNIFGNAIKYTWKWWKVDITLEKSKLIISDNGVGIKQEDQEKIFHRFYQSDSSRGQNGFCIWLALAKKIADIYKLKILMKSEEGKGSSFIIEF